MDETVETENETKLVRSLEDGEHNPQEDQHLGRGSGREWTVFTVVRMWSFRRIRHF